jgi:hypothetical protein
MVASGKEIRVAARLYEIRDSMRRLFGDKFPAIVAPYQQMLERVKAQTGLDDLAAATWLARRVDPGDGVEIMKIVAAAVETIEPTTVE